MTWDEETKRVQSVEGVTVRPKDFGGVEGVRYSNAGSKDLIPAPYLKTFLAKFESMGYTDGVNLRAATYDFRASGTAHVLKTQFEALRGLVEETVALNNGSRVHLISHSLGTSFVNIFLQDQELSWTEKNVASAVMMSPTNAGTPVAVQGAIMGPVFPYVPQQLPALVSPAIRTFPSILWMFPSDDGKGPTPIWGDSTFITTPTTNYSMSNLRALLHDMNASILLQVYDQVMDIGRRSLDSPGPSVPVLCIYANDSRVSCLTAIASRRNRKRTQFRATIPRLPSKSNLTIWTSQAARSSARPWATGPYHCPPFASATDGQRRLLSSTLTSVLLRTRTLSTKSEPCQQY